MTRFFIIAFVVIFGVVPVKGQNRIIYSEYDRNDNKNMKFEIIGKMNDNFLIYKNTKGRNYISVYNSDMKKINEEEMKYLPNNDRLVSVDFINYPDFAYGFYQFQRKNIMYCMAIKVDAMGKKLTEEIEIDTAKVGSLNSSRVFSVIHSEDKSKIMVFKINTKNKKNYLFGTTLLDKNLLTIQQAAMQIPMEERNENIGEFHLDNEGDMVFSKYATKNNEQITKAFIGFKPATIENISFIPLDIDKINLDEIRIKIDNYNKRYLLSSFYYGEKKGNVDGYYFYVWDKSSQLPLFEKSFAFSEELKKEARGASSTKLAFNDYFIQEIISRKDGGFIIASESYYTTSRYNSWNRWTYLNSPYLNRFDYYFYSPYYRNFGGYNRWNNDPATRHNSDNIMVSSFDKEGNAEWNNVIVKEQFSDQSIASLSFQLMNTGGLLHFLFNQAEKRMQLLTDYTISPEGDLKKSPTLKNLDKGYEFMPRYAKQVSAKQMIVPCLTRNYICFAKLEFN